MQSAAGSNCGREHSRYSGKHSSETSPDIAPVEPRMNHLWLQGYELPKQISDISHKARMKVPRRLLKAPGSGSFAAESFRISRIVAPELRAYGK